MTRLTPRSWLFVPGHEKRKITRASQCGSDAVILDLEDGVPPGDKALARATVQETLSEGALAPGTTWVRIGAVADGDQWRKDLEAVAGLPLEGLILPKVRSATDVLVVESVLDDLLPAAQRPSLVPIVTEQAEGVLAMRDSMSASAQIGTAFWGSEDLSADLKAVRVKDDAGQLLEVFAVVRSLFLLTCRASGIEPIDTPFLGLRDPEGLRVESLRAHRMGFAGKQVIHPDHVPVVNEAFLPSAAEVDGARAIVEAFEGSGGGALRVDDGMVDPPHLKRAKSLLARFEAEGVKA